MNCRTIHKEAIDYTMKKMSLDKMVEFRKHLETCVACSEKIHRLEVLMSVVDVEKITESDVFFYQRLEAKLQNEQNQIFSQKVYIRLLVPSLKVALIAATIVLGMFAGSRIQNIGTTRSDYVEAFANSQYLFDNNYEVIETDYLMTNQDAQ